MRPKRKGDYSRVVKKYEDGGKVGELLAMLSGDNPSDAYNYAAANDPTFGDSAAAYAKDYHNRRINSPMYRKQLKNALLNVTEYNRHPLINLGQGDLPSGRISDDLVSAIWDEQDDPNFSNKSRGELGKMLKGLTGKRGPLSREGKITALKDAIASGKKEVIDALLKFRSDVVNQNTVKTKSLDERGEWTMDLPWRPEGTYYGSAGKFDEGTGGVSLAPKVGGNPNKLDPTVTMAKILGVDNPDSGRMAAPRFMGPKALQEMQDKHRISNILASDPVSMRQAAVEELGHSSDPRKVLTQYDVLPYTKEMVRDMAKGPTDKFYNIWTDEERQARVTDKGYTDKHLEYLAAPTEVNQRLERVRSHLFDAGIDVFNKPINLKDPAVRKALEDLQALGNRNPFQDLQALFRDGEIEQLLNQAP